VPVHSDAWPKSKFSDGFHLSEAGAREFTQILSPSLYAILRSFEAKNSISALKPGPRSVRRY